MEHLLTFNFIERIPELYQNLKLKAQNKITLFIWILAYRSSQKRIYFQKLPILNANYLTLV